MSVHSSPSSFSLSRRLVVLGAITLSGSEAHGFTNEPDPGHLGFEDLGGAAALHGFDVDMGRAGFTNEPDPGFVGEGGLASFTYEPAPGHLKGLQIGGVLVQDAGDDLLQVEVLVVNDGDLDIGGFYVDLFSDAQVLPALGDYGDDYSYQPGLAAGASEVVTILIAQDDDGKESAGRSLVVIADTDGLSGDRDYSDNVVGARLAEGADLRVEDLKAELGEDRVVLTGVVTNIGMASSGAFYLDAFAGEAPRLGDSGADYVQVASLGRGEGQAFELWVTLEAHVDDGPISSTDDVWLLVDTDQWVAEPFEFNNLRGADLTGTCEDSYTGVVCGRNDSPYVATTSAELPTEVGSTVQLTGGHGVFSDSESHGFSVSEWFPVSEWSEVEGVFYPAE